MNKIKTQSYHNKSYLLDTNFLIAILRGDTMPELFLRNESELGASFEISVVSEAEILAGVATEDEEIVYEFLNSKEPRIVDRKIARLTGGIRRDNRLEGRVSKTPDAILIATCIEYNLILVSYDKKLLRYGEFCGVRTVDLNAWKPEDK